MSNTDTRATVLKDSILAALEQESPLRMHVLTDRFGTQARWQITQLRSHGLVTTEQLGWHHVNVHLVLNPKPKARRRRHRRVTVPFGPVTYAQPKLLRAREIQIAGVTYEVVPIPPSGYCGASALAVNA